MSAPVVPCPWCGTRAVTCCFAFDSRHSVVMMCCCCGARGEPARRVSGIAEPISDADRTVALAVWNARHVG